jgi:predicted nucleic acid-binding protein
MNCFVDTNVLLHLLDRKNDAKARVSEAWLRQLSRKDMLVLSPQVLNEFVNVIARGRIAAPLSEAARFVRSARRWCRAHTGYAETVKALQLRERFGFQWYDALIVSSAVNAGCAVFLSEDMQHGQIIEGLRIMNPFQVDPAAFFKTL